MSITQAHLFVAQSQLSVDDPDGPWTAGSPGDVIDWATDNTIAVTQVAGTTNRPGHWIIELADQSSFVVQTIQPECTIRIAVLSDLNTTADWDDDSPRFVVIGEQDKAANYREYLHHLMATAPRPSHVINNPKSHTFDAWAHAMTAALQQRSGEQAHRNAVRAWDSVQQQIRPKA